MSPSTGTWWRVSAARARNDIERGRGGARLEEWNDIDVGVEPSKALIDRAIDLRVLVKAVEYRSIA